jgi:lipoprotein-anchoring transpeptidase ErfK/SrfK
MGKGIMSGDIIMRSIQAFRLAASAFVVTVVLGAQASAEPLYMNDPAPYGGSIFQQVDRSQAPQTDNGVIDDQTAPSATLPDNLRRQLVAYSGPEAAGTIIIDTPHTYLYYVLGGGRAIRYGIGVGRDGFRWSGVQTVARKQEWPDWYPPAEMIARQPYLPRMMSGGPGNPLGARAMYLGNSEYRIHGTNDPTTIGKRVSSGCIRLTNEDVEDLYNRVTLGTKVMVLNGEGYHAAERAQPVRQQRVSYAPRPSAPINLNPAFASR